MKIFSTVAISTISLKVMKIVLVKLTEIRTAILVSISGSNSGSKTGSKSHKIRDSKSSNRYIAVIILVTAVVVIGARTYNNCKNSSCSNGHNISNDSNDSGCGSGCNISHTSRGKNDFMLFVLKMSAVL